MNDMSVIIKDTTEKIMQDLCTKEVIERAERGVYPMELWSALVETGLTAIGIEEESGGAGGSLTDALAVLRIAGKYSAPVPLAETIMANWMMARAGLPLLEKRAAVVFEERNVTFTESSEGWSVSGTANQVPWASCADSLVVMGQSTEGRMLAVIDADRCRIQTGANYAGEPRNEVTFTNVGVPAPEAWMVEDMEEDRWLLAGALVRAAQMTGALERLLHLTVQYSKERSQFGRPIARFQAVQQQIAVLAGEVAAASACTDLAVRSFEAGRGGRQIMAAKIRAGEAASCGVPIAHQVHGAIGFTDEHVLQQSTRRLWSWRDEFKTESYWAKRLGEEVLGGGADGLWPFVTALNQA
ncbi:MAG: acyl-CoA dehydrogenase family protein [Bacillus sp. (in: firmicutes)]